MSLPVEETQVQSLGQEDPLQWEMATVSLPTLFAEPRVDKARVGKLEGNSRSHRNWRRVDSLQTGAAAKGVSQVGLVYIYRTHVAPGQAGTL